MTTPRTIPANPQPGERYRHVQYSDGWAVEVRPPHEGYGGVVARGLSEADARLLVEGQATIDRLTARVAELEAALRNIQEACERDLASGIVPDGSSIWQIEANARAALQLTGKTP